MARVGGCCVASQVGTYIGQRVVTVLLRKTSRQSIIVLIIAFIISGSTMYTYAPSGSNPLTDLSPAALSHPQVHRESHTEL
jgi:hypothetical protein